MLNIKISELLKGKVYQLGGSISLKVEEGFYRMISLKTGTHSIAVGSSCKKRLGIHLEGFLENNQTEFKFLISE